MKPKALSVAKFGETMNEDGVVARPGLLAVSDGAGGGGLFADEWSKYLVSMLPDNPLTSFGELDGWLDGIWESFYSTCEQKARLISPMHLSKFYNEDLLLHWQPFGLQTQVCVAGWPTVTVWYSALIATPACCSIVSPVWQTLTVPLILSAAKTPSMKKDSVLVYLTSTKSAFSL